jgi:hypothetical protein
VSKEDNEGYIVEFIALGNSVKVTAFDPRTLKEAAIVGSPKATREQLAELAIRKLNYLLGKDEA